MSYPVTMFLHNFTHFPKLVIILAFTFSFSFLYIVILILSSCQLWRFLSTDIMYLFYPSVSVRQAHSCHLSSISTSLWDFHASVLVRDPRFLKPTSSSFLVSLMSFSNFFEEDCMRNLKCLRCCVWKCHYSTQPLMQVCLQIEFQVEIYFPLYFDCISPLSSILLFEPLCKFLILWNGRFYFPKVNAKYLSSHILFNNMTFSHS